MFIARGWGMLAILVPIVGILLGITFFGENGNATLPIFAYSLIASGLFTILLGIILQKKSSKKHDLYFLALPIWGFIWIGMGIFGIVYFEVM